MDIFNSEVRKIRCISNDSDLWFGANHHLLEVGKIYTLDDLDVHPWYTYVYLVEFPGVHFNSVVFEEVGEI